MIDVVTEFHSPFFDKAFYVKFNSRCVRHFDSVASNLILIKDNLSHWINKFIIFVFLIYKIVFALKTKSYNRFFEIYYFILKIRNWIWTILYDNITNKYHYYFCLIHFFVLVQINSSRSRIYPSLLEIVVQYNTARVDRSFNGK